MAFSWNAEPLMENTSATACYLRFSLDGWFTISTPGAPYAMMTSISILQVCILIYRQGLLIEAVPEAYENLKNKHRR